MESTTAEKEIIFRKCKESVEDVFGWKYLIFLPHNFKWRFLIVVTVIILYGVNTTQFFYSEVLYYSHFVGYLCDSFYFVDTICATLHFVMVNVRKLRHKKRRPLILLFIDYFSLIPFRVVFDSLIYGPHDGTDEISQFLSLNISLRLYQIYTYFSDVKVWIYKVKNYFIVTFIEIIIYTLILNHLMSCFLYYNFDNDLKKRCLKNLVPCIIENELVTFGLLSQNFVRPISKIPVEKYQLLVVFDFLIGYFLIYGYILPLVLFVSLKYFRGYFDFSNRCKQLKRWVDNSVEDVELKTKTFNYFHSIWTYGKGDRPPEILKVFPLCFQKNIFCDIHWDAYRHSDFLKNLSIGCKRSLSLKMRTEFILERTYILKQNEKKTCFLYLESGMLQIMAEENSKSPVITLSGGSVLGEAAFFLQPESKVILRTAKFSVIHVLRFTDLFRVLLDYPKDLKKLCKIMKSRIAIAKATQKRKMEICPQFLQNDSNYTTMSKKEQANLKWVKQQIRATLTLQKKYTIMQRTRQQEAMVSYQNQIQNLLTQLEHTSVYLSLLCVNDEVVNKYEAVCLRKSFPWLVNPQSNFLIIWNYVIVVISFVPVLLYPAFISWYPQIPTWFLDIANVITFLYIADVFMILSTAVKIKNVVTPSFWSGLVFRLTSPWFYADVIAALPLQVFIYYTNQNLKPFEINLYFLNALFKTYKLIKFINDWNYSVKPGVVIRTMIKYLFILNVSLYWFAAIINLTSVECLFYQCSLQNWFIIFSQQKGNEFRNYAAAFMAVFLGLEISGEILVADVFYSYVISFMGLFYFHLLFVMWQAEGISSNVLERSHELKYKHLMEYVFVFMQQNNISTRIQKRVMDTMQFQWYFDYGNYLTRENRISDTIETKLKDEIDRRTILTSIGKSFLFSFDDENIQMDLCRKAHRLALPANSVLLTFGTQIMSFYTLHKGFVQLNSFLPGDNTQNVGKPIVLKSGDTFPVIVILNQMPAAVSARTITDCELIILDLEDVLSTMIVYKTFKDVVEAIKETDLTALSLAKLGLSQVQNIFAMNEEDYKNEFAKLKFFGFLLRFLLCKKSIDSSGKRYIQWECFRVIIIVISLFLWATVFGSMVKSEKFFFIYFLLCLDSITVIDMYIRLHVAFYNKIGIYVIHPLATSKHYLTSSFILDIISFCPSFHIIHLLRYKMKFSFSVSVTHITIRSIALYRFLGFMSYLKETRKSFYHIDFIKNTILILLLIHFYINLTTYTYIEGLGTAGFSYNYNMTDTENSAFDYYFNEFTTVFLLIIRWQFFFKSFNLFTILHILIFGIFGWIAQINLFAFLTIKFASSNMSFTIHQYYMKSFVKFLNSEKAADDISNKAIDHFEHEWEENKGENLVKIFSRFPNILHEDLMFSLYKQTLSAVRCLSEANEAFYRTLSRHLIRVHIRKGSTLIFPFQVRNEILFIHKGKGYVKEFSKMLYKGSMIGDIRRRGVMKNTVTAQTHIDLLKISSTIFFLTINNFHWTKKAFEREIIDVEDFVESVYTPAHDADVLETFTLKKTNDLSESQFEAVSDDVSKGLENLQSPRNEKLPAKFEYLIYPTSRKYYFIKCVFLLNAYFTGLLIPTIIAIGILSSWSKAIVYSLDVIWIFKIFATLRTAYLDPKTGNIITDKKAILNQYLYCLDGLILDIVSFIPIELILYIYFAATGSYKHCRYILFCYIPRLLRFVYLLKSINREKKKLSINLFFRWVAIVGLKMIFINCGVSLNLLLCNEDKYELKDCYWEFDNRELEAFLRSYLCVLNNYVGGGMFICMPETRFHMFFQILIGIWSIISRALLVNQVLTIIYVTHHAKSNQMYELDELEKYLTVRDISPALFQRTRQYFCDLLDSYKEGAMPSFLKSAPSYLKKCIMSDLYVQHLQSCYIFQGIHQTYLDQLSARLERFIYFPGDYITKKGDVDHNIYFVHKGEVYCIDYDANYPALEKVVDMYMKGESFGVLQGILLSHPHSNTFRAKTLSEILVLNYKQWEDMRLAFPDITKYIYAKAGQIGNVGKAARRDYSHSSFPFV